jgi:hypothetical protein
MDAQLQRITLLRNAGALGLCMALVAAVPQAATPRPGWNPEQLLLNAFLVPALEQGAIPLRWIDPRNNLHCGPNAEVRVNGELLRAGALVPNQPFELAWQAHDCRPFGVTGPRFNGGVTLTVFREDWGFSAIVVPAGLHFTWASGEVVKVLPHATWMPRNPQVPEPLD